jgi:hypothetical protein
MHKLIRSITEDEDELKFVYTLAYASMGEAEDHILELDDSTLPAMEKWDISSWSISSWIFFLTSSNPFRRSTDNLSKANLMLSVSTSLGLGSDYQDMDVGFCRLILIFFPVELPKRVLMQRSVTHPKD